MIDWITVVAQIINFIVLVVLLKIFLYGRILRAIDERKQRIEREYEEAETKQTKAEQEATDYRQKQQEFDDRREQMLQNARDEAEQLRQERIEQVEQDIRQRKQQWLDSLQNQRTSFLSELRRTSARQLATLTRKVLEDLAGASLQPQVLQAFADRMQSLDDDARRQLRKDLSDHDGAVEVASAFELDDQQKQTVDEALGAVLDDTPDLTFTVDEDLICGLQVRAAGRAVGWNVDDYVTDLVDRLDEAMDEHVNRLRESTGHDRADDSDTEEHARPDEQPADAPGADKEAEDDQ